MPEISIIVPCYKATEYLPETVESILSQSYKDFELLLIDDHSDDEGATYSMIKNYSLHNPKIKAFQTPNNMGPGRTRNYGLSEAMGKYICFIDADDTIAPDMFMELHDLAVKYDSDVVKCNLDYFQSSGKGSPTTVEEKPTVRRFTDKKQLMHLAALSFGPTTKDCSEDYGSHGSACALIVKRSVLRNNNVKFSEEPHMLAEDFAFCYEMLYAASSYVTTTRVLYHYRINDDSRSRKATPDILERLSKSADYFLKLIKKYDNTDDDRKNVESYAIGMLRGALKREFMAPGSFKEKKRWFLNQKEYKIFRMAYEEYPWRQLPFKHRLGFELFYKKKFLPLYVLIVGQEIFRKILKSK